MAVLRELERIAEEVHDDLPAPARITDARPSVRCPSERSSAPKGEE
jgi:hypothetical protein